MGTTKCEKCNKTKVNTIKHDQYIPCLYERFFLIGKPPKPKIEDSNRWHRRIIVALLLYGFIVGFFYYIKFVFAEHVNSEVETAYTYAAYAAASIIFWPFIVILDSEFYYKTCVKLRCLIKSPSSNQKWYNKCAEECFGTIQKLDLKSAFFLLANIGCLALIIGAYFSRLYTPNILPQVIRSHISSVVIFVALGSVFIPVISETNRNILLAQSVANCGVAYYEYVIEFSNHAIQPLFSTDFLVGTMIIIALLYIAFFIAGTTILPMLGVFKAFLLSGYENMFSYPLNRIACSIDTIQEIKMYFMHLAGVASVAYIQLVFCVYPLGLLNTDFVITPILFIVGSFFPVVMYLAASIFFKRFCNNVYICQVRNIDIRIYKAIKRKSFDADEIQALVGVKEMYANEFEIHAEMNKEILLAVLTPIVTALLTVFFPNLFPPG